MQIPTGPGAAPILLPPSEGNVEKLVAAIVLAAESGVPLQLLPGVHLTKPGVQNIIPIGAHGLRIMPAPQLSTGRHMRPTIKRESGSIDPDRSDDNHGLFFVPAEPTTAELEQVTWRRYQHGSDDFDFDVIVRGRVRIEGVGLDCNMGEQGLPTDPDAKNKAEHSCMLGVAGHKYEQDPSDAGRKRFIFVGFEAVELVDVTTKNGGYADDVWFSRGYFHPNVARVEIDHLITGERVGPHRSTICFSGLCQSIEIRNSELDSLDLEDTASVNYRDLPRATPHFSPSVWRLSSIKMRSLDLGASGKTYTIHGSQLETTEQCVIHQAGGDIADSTFQVGPRRRRLLCLDDLVFRRVEWTLERDDKHPGQLASLVITPRDGVPSSVSFIDNTFLVDEPAPNGSILDSEYSANKHANKVTVRATGCHYPASFGMVAARPIARVNQRGTWTFARADLEGRDPDIALPKDPHQDVFRNVE